jgi:hypothetical protein
MFVCGETPELMIGQVTTYIKAQVSRIEREM